MITTANVVQGTLKGVPMDGFTLFKGVPYAAPPVGRRRLAPPQPALSWQGVRLADQFGCRCPHQDHQPGSFYQKEFFRDAAFMPPMSEDCLYLNIWTPAASAEERLPVAVYIHGGGYVEGSGCDAEFDGEALCKQGLVMITINYRLNAFGFLAHPWLTAEAGRSGNYGILDQIAALEWIRDNIASFGGDPNYVTIFGQSAGALSVQTIISSPLSTGLVHGAILQSAGGYDTGIANDRTLAEAESMGVEFAKMCGAETLEQMRALPVETIVKNVQIVRQQRRGLSFAPVVDGYLLKKGYDKIVDNGDHLDVPYMIGLTENDIGMTADMLASGEKSRLYHGCVQWSLKNAQLGRKPAYVYYFTHKPLGDDAGAFHCAELWYMFGLLHRSWRPKDAADYALEKGMVAAWSNFIKRGNPNGDGAPEWIPCAEPERFVRVFD
ncbi:MAG: carboxylesterase family protein [Oscillospiraceae bacterium]|jgi:para-nitrobenzyl esterase|nr:carboxylesterase family protein [Oscillospiraceae bacterium]